MKRNTVVRTKLYVYFAFVLYIYLVFTYTLFNRGITHDFVQTGFLWSYKVWLSFDLKTGWQIIGNIVLFVPIGLLLSLLTDKKRFLVFPFLFSCLIETLQFLTMRGLFEFDDIFNNSLGAWIGWAIQCKIGKRNSFVCCLCSMLALSCIVLASPTPETNLPRAFCFQIEEDGEGFVFRPDYLYKENTRFMLRNTRTGELKDASATYEIDRPDVENYFGYAYCKPGFKLMLTDEENEVLVHYNPFLCIPTGVYISSSGIHYVPEADFSPPEIDADFVRYGILRVYRPDFHCWIYQYENSLYWIADEDFIFEDDGSTYIQFQLWTTQENKLPEIRIENGWMWDNIGGYFENYELDRIYGTYRVMRRELPKDYPIISILTGYHKDNEWIWKEYFRPYYEL